MTVGCNILRSLGHNNHRSQIFSLKYPNLVHSLLDKIFVQHKNPTTNCLLSYVTFTLHLLLIWTDCNLQRRKKRLQEAQFNGRDRAAGLEPSFCARAAGNTVPCVRNIQSVSAQVFLFSFDKWRTLKKKQVASSETEGDEGWNVPLQEPQEQVVMIVWQLHRFEADFAQLQKKKHARMVVGFFPTSFFSQHFGT